MFNVFIYKVWKHQNIWRESVDGGASINVVISLTRQMLNSELNNQNIWRQFKKKCLLMVKHQLMWSSLTRQMLKSELNNSRLQTTINIYDIVYKLLSESYSIWNISDNIGKIVWMTLILIHVFNVLLYFIMLWRILADTRNLTMDSGLCTVIPFNRRIVLSM